MEELLGRYPNICQNIFEELNDKDLFSSREVSRSWHHFISNEKSYKQRIQAYKRLIQESIKKFFMNHPNPYEIQNRMLRGQTILHFAALEGNEKLIKSILFRQKNKNPQDKFGKTPLHYAAKHGHFNICQFICENVKEKNPRCIDGKTPLHLAAINGHLEICKFLFSEAENKNPQGCSTIHFRNGIFT